MNKPIVAVDTSVIIAALLSWHEHHEPARVALERAIEQNTALLPLPCLTEAYAVLTRLPPPHRLTPAVAEELLRDNFAANTKVVSLRANAAWNHLRHITTNGIAGGLSYDALIVACAKQGGAAQILTLNRKDFNRVADGLAIVEPSA